MKRILGGIILGIAGIAIIVAVPFASVRAAGLNNFSITTYDIEYDLSKNADNRSVLKTNETIVADFKVANQNHGIERAIPNRYNNHSTNLKINRVVDGEGEKHQYTTYSANGNDVLRIGSPDSYVYEPVTYNLNYSQQDVTRFYKDTDSDEWYWDTNGTGWQVPIEQLTVKVRLDSSLANIQKNEPYCYVGASGSNTRCVIEKTSEGEYKVVANHLASGENVTVSFGFPAGTFAQYQMPFGQKILLIWGVLTLVTGLLGGGVLTFLCIAYARRRNRSGELHTIPVQYIPPKHTSLFVAGQIVTPMGSVFSAQLVDLAVRRIIQIIETKPASTWKLAQYDIKMLVDGSTQLKEIQEMLSDMWGSLPKANDRISLSDLKNNTSYAIRTMDNDKKLTTLIEGEYAIREHSKQTSQFFYRWAAGMLIAALITASVPLLFFAGVVSILGYTIRPLTDKGVEMRRYLLGLNIYIKASEVERLKFFQAPDTAEKIGESVNTDNPGQILKLYERVLPYAILFGHEKEWTKQLGEYYTSTETDPGWYSGSSAFNAAVFTSAISSFSSAASYSSGVSSSTGGSSGGGSSGGGGGGGGGGGW